MVSPRTLHLGASCAVVEWPLTAYLPLCAENPLERAATIATTNNFQTPLDEIDAAARVLDPVIQPLIDRQAAVATAAATGEVSDVEAPPHGLFFKDFRETEW